jgi:hypothetical protein
MIPAILLALSVPVGISLAMLAGSLTRSLARGEWHLLKLDLSIIVYFLTVATLLTIVLNR